MELDQQVRSYLVQNLLYIDDASQYDNDASFIGEGLIDSMGVMELVTYVQSRFGIPVEQHEVTPDNFDSVSKLVAFIRNKQSAEMQTNGTHAGTGRATASRTIAP